MLGFVVGCGAAGCGPAACKPGLGIGFGFGLGLGLGSRLELGFCLGAGVLTDDEVAIREVTTGADSTVHAPQSLEVSKEYTVADIQFHHAR
jgi:hypothetical protein